MKKLWVLAGSVVGLAAINARIDAKRQCSCQPDCWCQQPGLRNFRWVLPFGHKDVSPEWKKQMESPTRASKRLRSSSLR
jgi:hypothetical protein